MMSIAEFNKIVDQFMEVWKSPVMEVYRHLWSDCLGSVTSPQLTTAEVSTACYGDSPILLYVDNVRTSQETYILASTACYGDSLT
jgi:hypothetical protein